MNQFIYEWKHCILSGISPAAREYHAMAQAGEGKALLFGGVTGEFKKTPDMFLNDMWVFDVQKGLWTSIAVTSKIPERRRLHQLVSVGDNQMVLFGGHNMDSAGELNDTWEYDAVLNRWTEHETKECHPPARAGHGMAHDRQGRIILFGGYHTVNGKSQCLSDTWEYDVIVKKWSKIKVSGPSPPARSYHAICTLEPGRILLFGGNGYSDTWIFDCTSRIWNQIDLEKKASPPARRYHAMSMIKPGVVVVAGGFLGNFPNLSDMWQFSVETKTWRRVDSDLPPARHGHSMVHIGNKQILLFGGFGDGKLCLNDTWELRFFPLK
jgi:N-acetylneuraminic acid mutarotase